MRRLVFIDTESTGLDARLHQVCEVAWACEGESGVHELVPPHTLEFAEARALEVNRYYERGLFMAQLDERRWAHARAALCADLAGAALVAANPAFDAAMLTKLLGYAPWHYRLRDIQERAAAVLDLDDSPSMFTIATMLRDRGFSIPEPDHTAAADVRALRASWHALSEVAAGRRALAAA